jgi:hypothetical protein
MSGDGFAQLLDAATADVPPRHRQVPLAAINRRIRRRRAWVAGAAGTAMVAVLLGGFAVVRGVLAAPPGPPPAGIPTRTQPSSSADPAALPWASAFVARDDRTVTIYGGVDGCRELAQPRATLTVQDAGQVVIGLFGKVVDAADCTTAWRAVPVTVTLPLALGARQIRDAAGGSRPVYHERDLPQLPVEWTTFHGDWGAEDALWSQGYNGPNGTEVHLSAQPDDSPPGPGPTVTTVKLGPHQGTITASGFGLWQVWWRVGNVRYSLDYEPSEGGTFTLAEFKGLLASLRWS